MTRFDYIGKHLIIYKEGVKYGLISISVLNHFRIYTQYLNYLSLGCSIGRAVFLISECNKVSEILVHKIKKEMEEEV